ncbi:MAG TPA: hypothetical protein VF836_04145 [Gemmatimonadaceae bacterium]
MPGKVFRSCAVFTLIAPVVAAILGLAACGSDRIVDPPLPPDAEQFSPPAVYTTWWNMTQACSGLTGSLGAVTWYTTSQVLHDVGTGDVIIGYWTAGSNRIVMLSSAMLDGGAVRHEMLHSLIGQGGHPRSQFLGKCAGTVDCERGCITDGGPYPPPPESPIHEAGDSIDLTVEIAPTNPTSGFDGGFFSITVTAHNRSTHWATVTPASPTTDTASTVSYDAVSPAQERTGGAIASDPSERIFAPGETKKHVFDFRIGDDPFLEQLQPGNYTIRGGFSDYWSSTGSFVIGP